MFKSAIMGGELDDGGKHNKTTNRENSKHNIKSNLVELNKVQKQPQGDFGKKYVLINSSSGSCQGKFLVLKSLKNIFEEVRFW